jgi:predicted metalloendopeptidase
MCSNYACLHQLRYLEFLNTTRASVRRIGPRVHFSAFHKAFSAQPDDPIERTPENYVRFWRSQ